MNFTTKPLALEYVTLLVGDYCHCESVSVADLRVWGAVFRVVCYMKGFCHK